MRLVRDASRVWLDAGPFFRFCEAGELPSLARYVGPRAHWVVDVANEIELRGSSPRPALRTHPALQNLVRRPARSDARSRRQRRGRDDPDGLGRPGRPSEEASRRDRHRPARRASGRGACGLDDGEGKGLARARDVPFLSTTNLAAEKVVAGALAEPAGKAIYLSVQKKVALTEANWVSALARCRAL